MRKRTIVLVLLVTMFAIMGGCQNDNAENNDRSVVDKQQKQYQIAQPVPFFDFSQVRDSLIQIYGQLARATSTYTVITAQGNGKLIFQCPSYGFPIPADTQLTNPLQVTYPYQGSIGYVVEQAEPAGVFTSKNTDGTYVLCARKNGDIGVVYSEQKVTSYGFGVICDGDGYCTDDESSLTTLKVDLKKPLASTEAQK